MKPRVCSFTLIIATRYFSRNDVNIIFQTDLASDDLKVSDNQINGDEDSTCSLNVLSVYNILSVAWVTYVKMFQVS